MVLSWYNSGVVSYKLKFLPMADITAEGCAHMESGLKVTQYSKYTRAPISVQSDIQSTSSSSASCDQICLSPTGNTHEVDICDQSTHSAPDYDNWNKEKPSKPEENMTLFFDGPLVTK